MLGRRCRGAPRFRHASGHIADAEALGRPRQGWGTGSLGRRSRRASSRENEKVYDALCPSEQPTSEPGVESARAHEQLMPTPVRLRLRLPFTRWMHSMSSPGRNGLAPLDSKTRDRYGAPHRMTHLATQRLRADAQPQSGLR